MRRTLHPRLTGLCAAVVSAGLMVSGCSGVVRQDDVAGANGKIRGVEVTGQPGTRPRVDITTPLKITRTRAVTAVQGTGGPVYLDRTFILELTMYNARTGKLAVSTYAPGQHPITVTETGASLFPVLTQALLDKTQGSRVVVAARAADAYGAAGAPQYGIAAGDPVVMVADIVAVPPKEILTGPQGTYLRLPKGLPVVRRENGIPTGFAFGAAHGLRKPRNLVVVPLVRGTGPQVTGPTLVALNYLGQVWGTDRQFADTYTKEPVIVPIGVNRVVEAWDRALRGVRRGSRLLVITPPRLAFKNTGSPPEIPADATLAYVIDVLGVS